MLTSMMFFLISIQDAGSEAVTAVAPAAPSELPKYLKTLAVTLQKGEWQAVAALALIFGVYLVRKVTPKMLKSFGAWLNTDRGGSTLVMVSAMLGVVGTAVASGQKLSFSHLLAGLTTGAMASGARNVVWDILFPSDEPKKAPKSTPAPAATETKTEEKQP